MFGWRLGVRASNASRDATDEDDQASLQFAVTLFGKLAAAQKIHYLMQDNAFPKPREKYAFSGRQRPRQFELCYKQQMGIMAAKNSWFLVMCLFAKVYFRAADYFGGTSL